MTPNLEQAEQAMIAQAEMLEAMDRLVREGIDWRIVLTGSASALAATVERYVGADNVSAYFAAQASIAATVIERAR